MQFFNGTNFWKSPTDYKPGEKLTTSEVKEIEAHLGVSLPEKYVQYMCAQNGGELFYRYVLFDDGEVAVIPYLHELEVDRGVGLSNEFINICQLPKGLVLLTGDLDAWLTLDYRNKEEEPAVIYVVQNELGWEEHKIASSFESFTKKLFTKKEWLY